MAIREEKHQLFIILLIVLLGFIGNSIAYPIFAPLFLHPHQSHIVSNSWGSHWRSLGLGITLMMYPLGQFIAAPILGTLSDQHGRKKVLLGSTAVMTFGYLLTAVALTYQLLALLIISRLITGCCEANTSIARAMVIDMTGLNKQKSLGWINAAGGLGYILGPLLGGVLADNQLSRWFSFSLPFYVAALFSLGLGLITIIGLQESLRRSSESSPIHFMQQLNVIYRLRRLCQNRSLKYLLLASTLATLAIDTFYEFYPAYMAGLWHATPIQIAGYTVLLSAVMTLSSGWLNHTLLHYFPIRRVIVIALWWIIVMLVGLLFKPSTWWVMGMFMILGAAISVAVTSYTIQVSDVADASIQGEVMGILWGLRMLFDGITSLMGGGLILLAYSAPLALAAVAALLSWWGYTAYFMRQKMAR